jgi:hypothetical protein
LPGPSNRPRGDPGRASSVLSPGPSRSDGLRVILRLRERVAAAAGRGRLRKSGPQRPESNGSTPQDRGSGERSSSPARGPRRACAGPRAAPSFRHRAGYRCADFQGQQHNGGHERATCPVGLQVDDEIPVKLDDVGLQAEHVVERGVTGPDVIDGDLHTGRAFRLPPLLSTGLENIGLPWSAGRLQRR